MVRSYSGDGASLGIEYRFTRCRGRTVNRIRRPS
jgi:hypothetical protein